MIIFKYFVLLTSLSEDCISGTLRVALERSCTNASPVWRDTDGDGLVDSVEEKIGTNINAKDSDGDSLSDADEFLIYATNGTNAHTSTEWEMRDIFYPKLV